MPRLLHGSRTVQPVRKSRSHSPFFHIPRNPELLVLHPDPVLQSPFLRYGATEKLQVLFTPSMVTDAVYVLPRLSGERGMMTIAIRFCRLVRVVACSPAFGLV